MGTGAREPGEACLATWVSPTVTFSTVNEGTHGQSTQRTREARQEPQEMREQASSHGEKVKHPHPQSRVAAHVGKIFPDVKSLEDLSQGRKTF